MIRNVTKLAPVLTSALLLGWVGVAGAFDGFPPGKWWKNPELGSKLQLSSTQVAEIEKLFTEQRMRLIDLKAEAEKRELELESLLQADGLDQQKLEPAIDRVNEARGSLNKARLLMQVRVWQVLTAEQRRQVRAWQGARRDDEQGPPGRPKSVPPRKGKADDPDGRGHKPRTDSQTVPPPLARLSLDRSAEAP